MCKSPEVVGVKDDWRELTKVMEAAGQREGKEAKGEAVEASVWTDHGIHVNKIILTSVERERRHSHILSGTGVGSLVSGPV